MNIEDREELERLEYERELGRMEVEYKAMPKALKVELVRRVENIKSNWYEWDATANGVSGTVQADFSGELIAHETFEPYE